MEHAYFSPSASSRWIACPASLFMAEQTENKTSKYAYEGIVCHDIAAKILVSQDIVASDYAGKVVDGVEMTPELINGVQFYVDELRGLAKEHCMTGGKIEYQVKLTKDCWGTADAVLWNKDTLLIADLKMGKGVVVPAEDNSQLKLYSLGCLKWLEDTQKIKPIKILNIIIQPRTVNPIRIAELTRDALANWYVSDIKPILSTVKPGVNSGRECNPGVAQCKWCPVSAICTAQANRMVNDAQQAFAPFTVAEAPQPTTQKKMLSLEDIAYLKGYFIHIQQWMKTVDEFLKEKALAGESIPGFKLVEGRSNRKWKTDEAQIAAFIQNLNLEPYKKTLVTPPQAEKLMGKKVAKEYGLDNYITKPPGKPTLVLQADPRPEMQMRAEEEFEEFVPNKVSVNETPIIVEDEDSQPLSALARMKMAAFESEPEPEIPNEPVRVEPEPKTEIATGGSPDEPAQVVIKAEGKGTSTPPASKTKRAQVLDLGKGGVTLHDAASVLGCSENMVRMHLRYLNERDGYSYEILADNTFRVY